MEFCERDWLACCGSVRFSQQMVAEGPLSSSQAAITAAKDIWFNKIDVNGWLEAFAAHPQIGESSSETHNKSTTSAQWSKGEQSTALATANESTLQELHKWNARYRNKFGFVFLIFASGRSTPEILAELKRRYQNRPIVEFELAAKEQMKITELRISKLFSTETIDGSTFNTPHSTSDAVAKAGDRVSVIGGHLSTPEPEARASTRTRPPITTHILDVARGAPAAGVEVRLEMWVGQLTHRPGPFMGPLAGDHLGSWRPVGQSTTDEDGRTGRLMVDPVEGLSSGVYRISFDTGGYNPGGFYPYVSVVFEVREGEGREHFHVPLLLSPFSFTTYRGS